MAAIKALQQWCKIQCDGYRDVTITNMTTSFRDGLAFCALIHKHRPDLINYDSLAKENVYDNNNMAFHVAEERLGIAALLDAEDMVALRVPDRLSILTYVSQYYNYFNGRTPIGGVSGVKRPAEGSKEEPSGKKNLPVTAKPLPRKVAVENRPPLTNVVAAHAPKPAPTTDQLFPQKVFAESSNKTGTLSGACAVCKHHVHLVQRHLVDGRLYHRSCFKCSECSKTLLSGDYKAGPDLGTFTCTAHPRPQDDHKAATPLTKSDRAPAPRPVSVLSAPVRAEAKPVDPPPAAKPWTTSAQKTQAARQRFFLSTPATAETTPSSQWAPAAPESRGPSKDRDGKRPDKVTEGNHNNNNISNISCVAASNHWAGHRVPPANVPSSKSDANGLGAAEIKPVEPVTRLKTTIPTNHKEAAWQKSIHKDYLSTISTRIKDFEKSKTGERRPADWRSMLKPVPSGHGLNSEMEDAQCPLKPPQNGTTESSLPILTASVPCSSSSISPDNERTPSPKPHPESRSRDFTSGTGPSSTNPSTPESNMPTGRSFCIPVKDIQLELQEIEERLSDLEKQGVEMEKELRQREAEGDEDIFDTLMVDWFNLIQNKQVYIRRESELVYIAKTQYLEEQQPGVEGELRRLMDKPEQSKTAAEQRREQELMAKLMDIVNDRNAIVVVLDEDRLREEEEDQQLHQMMEKLGKKKEKSKKSSPVKKLFGRRSKKDRVKN